jgi:DNA-directed RNA polymerase beta subunit
MTESGTFIYNGAERVVVSQLVRSPGIYYSTQFDKTGKKLFSKRLFQTEAHGLNMRPIPMICFL